MRAEPRKPSRAPVRQGTERLPGEAIALVGRLSLHEEWELCRESCRDEPNTCSGIKPGIKLRQTERNSETRDPINMGRFETPHTSSGGRAVAGSSPVSPTNSHDSGSLFWVWHDPHSPSED